MPIAPPHSTGDKRDDRDRRRTNCWQRKAITSRGAAFPQGGKTPSEPNNLAKDRIATLLNAIRLIQFIYGGGGWRTRAREHARLNRQDNVKGKRFNAGASRSCSSNAATDRTRVPLVIYGHRLPTASLAVTAGLNAQTCRRKISAAAFRYPRKTRNN